MLRNRTRIGEPVMFRSAELGRTVSKEDFKHAVPQLRLELVQLQRQLMDRAQRPVIILISGIHCAGRSETANILNEWMDPRFLVTEAYSDPTREERQRPPFWRFWRDLPPKGRIGLYLFAWYNQPMIERFTRRIGRREFEAHLDRAVAFEKTLADDGAMVVKFWMHLGRDRQKKRLKKLSSDPLQRWRIGPGDWELWRKYDRYLKIAETTVGRTSTAWAPWKIVEGDDHRYRSLEVGRSIRDLLRVAPCDERPTPRPVAGEVADPPTPGDEATDLVAASLLPSLKRNVLGSLDMSLAVAKSDYKIRLAELQSRLNGFARRAREKKLPVIAVFEGWDAAGKGGAVRRLTAAMDIRDYRVIPVAAPTDEERAHHYLWRFWRHLGRAGRMTIFDRSWYGRVLVERVEGFASEPEWRRAYAEINDFEAQLTEFGVVVLKFWMHITSDEQLARFEARESTPHKRWKLTDEDWRNREKWDAYEQAVQEMVERTSTSEAPWTLVEGNCKLHARLKVLGTVADALERALGSKSKKK
jgi:polyphosphate:AMP phosphotransferase